VFDGAMVSSNIEDLSKRLTEFDSGCKLDADMVISVAKTEGMTVRKPEKVEKSKLSDLVKYQGTGGLKHTCSKCGRAFSKTNGLKKHEVLWCNKNYNKFMYEEKERPLQIVDTRGSGADRIFLVCWEHAIVEGSNSYSEKFKCETTDYGELFEIERVVEGPFDYCSEGEDTKCKESYLVKYANYPLEYIDSASSGASFLRSSPEAESMYSGG
jgi:hypothetical protein